MYGHPELCLNVGEEGAQNGWDFRLLSHRERPEIVAIVVKHDKVIFVARIAQNGGSPDISM